MQITPWNGGNLPRSDAPRAGSASAERRSLLPEPDELVRRDRRSGVEPQANNASPSNNRPPARETYPRPWAGPLYPASPGPSTRSVAAVPGLVDNTPREQVEDTPPPPPPPRPAPAPAGPADLDRIFMDLKGIHDQGYTGKGVTIAVIDSGIYPHPDLGDRIKAWADLADHKDSPYDAFGHGTNVAGIAAGSGKASQGKLAGVAPEADLVGVRITTPEEAIKGLKWVVENKDKYGIGVVNLSLGDPPNLSYKDDPWTQAVEDAIKAGLVVVVSAGNEGHNKQPRTISRPGIDPEAITVGALDLKGTLDPSDDQVAEFSSRGPTPTDEIPKPDLIAPGVRVFGPLSPHARLDVPELAHVGRDYLGISGTSQATPYVAGAAALLLQANPTLTHGEVKKILMDTARKYVKDDAMGQGAGVLDVGAAVKSAVAMASQGPVAATVAVAGEGIEPRVSVVSPEQPAGLRLVEEEWHIATA